MPQKSRAERERATLSQAGIRGLNHKAPVVPCVPRVRAARTLTIIQPSQKHTTIVCSRLHLAQFILGSRCTMQGGDAPCLCSGSLLVWQQTDRTRVMLPFLTRKFCKVFQNHVLNDLIHASHSSSSFSQSCYFFAFFLFCLFVLSCAFFLAFFFDPSYCLSTYGDYRMPYSTGMLLRISAP